MAADEATTVEKKLEDFEPQRKPKRNKYASACAVLASMLSILLGYGQYFKNHFPSNTLVLNYSRSHIYMSIVSSNCLQMIYLLHGVQI